ncbi:MAG: hypothetical protein WA476_14710 [Acidobacteriaceae bacterium]
MNRIPSLIVKSLVTLLLGSGALAANLQAQIDLSMTATIPFPFTVGIHPVPAGTYRFGLASSPFFLSVLDVKTGHEQIFFVSPQKERAFEPHGRLIFRNSEGSIALSQIRFPGTDMFSAIDPPRSLAKNEARKIEAKRLTTGNAIAVTQLGVH